MRRLLLALILAGGFAGTAAAMETCRGQLSASPLRPLPVPAVVGVDLRDNSPENTQFAAAFTRGMSDAGAKVPGGSAATVQLRLNWQVLSPGGGNDQGGGNRPVPAQPGPQGGIDRTLPDIPNQHVFLPGPPLQAGLLIFRAEARDPTGSTIYWIGSVQCTLQAGENETLLYQLGRVIGASIGQRRDHVPI